MRIDCEPGARDHAAGFAQCLDNDVTHRLFKISDIVNNY